MFGDLRARAAGGLRELEFSGYALGGLSVGEPQALMLETAEACLPLLPEGKPRYVMGVGKPEDLVELVDRGADMFDCVLPTRNARNGQLFTRQGTLTITHSVYQQDALPPDPSCPCYTCRNFSRAYLRHLFLSRELLAYRLNTIHNVYYFVNLLKEMRAAILGDAFVEFKKGFYAERDI
jgi:queuine tRNA-ribosyltransferase